MGMHELPSASARKKKRRPKPLNSRPCYEMGHQLQFRSARRTERFQSAFVKRRTHMITILIVVLLLLAIGAIPSWPHSREWGYGPSGGLSLVVLILVILMLTGRV
jgi:hypothetical protein